jgi:hypothetical protein
LEWLQYPKPIVDWMPGNLQSISPETNVTDLAKRFEARLLVKLVPVIDRIQQRLNFVRYNQHRV